VLHHHNHIFGRPFQVITISYASIKVPPIVAEKDRSVHPV